MVAALAKAKSTACEAGPQLYTETGAAGAYGRLVALLKALAMAHARVYPQLLPKYARGCANAQKRWCRKTCPFVNIYVVSHDIVLRFHHAATWGSEQDKVMVKSEHFWR
jgi:hypothetical protein